MAYDDSESDENKCLGSDYAARGSGRDAPEFDADELERQTGVSSGSVQMHAVKKIGEQYRLDFEEVALARDILMEDYVDFRSNGSGEELGEA